MFFSPKELFVICLLFFKMLYSIVKFLMKSGLGWLVLLSVVLSLLTPALPFPQEKTKIFLDWILLLCLCWFAVRFMVRLAKKDKEWGSIRRLLKKKDGAVSPHSDTTVP